ncbi:hypothetical protein AURDEDRAFT_113354 [Auricularia subglabra TFB-10046 SS5]|nr:hypothetical protein AURDEDRAFT_113354 [Auricularia subglabra TFB-10046 SS5]
MQTDHLPQPCASCGVFFDNEAIDHGERIPGAQTGPRAQLIAIVRALEIAHVNDGPLRIKTSSDYAVKAIRDWLPGFMRNGWRTQAGAPVQNKELLQYVAALLDFRGVIGQRVELAHVEGEPTRPADIEGFQNAQYLAQEASTSRPSATEPDWDALRRTVEARGETMLKQGGAVPLRASNASAGSSQGDAKKTSSVVWAKPKTEPAEKGKENAPAPLGKGGRSMLESAARALERREVVADVIEIDDDDDDAFELTAAQIAALDEIEAVYSQSSQPRV